MNKLLYSLFILTVVLGVQDAVANTIDSYQVMWRADDGDETNATNQDVGRLKVSGQNVRLRIELLANAQDGEISDTELTLQYRQGTSGDWTNVGTTDAHFKMGESSYITDGEEGSSILSSSSFLGAQLFDQTSVLTFASSSRGYYEYEFSIQATDQAVSGVYYFRLNGCDNYNEDAILVYGESLPFEGEGTEEEPFVISTLDDLRTLSESSEYYSFYFEQTADIDASDTQTWNSGNHDGDETTDDEAMGFLPIGRSSYYFTGTYNGNGFAISGLYINRPTSSYVGLFGYVSYGEISDLKVSDSEISGNGYVGGLVGYNYYSTVTNCSYTGTITGAGSKVGGLTGQSYHSSVTDCYSSGTVTGSGDYTGGLVGYNYISSTISECYSTCEVTGSGQYTGGLSGNSYQGSNIENCYCTGSVSGSGNTGGFVGINYTSTISNCYNTGAVTGSGYTGGFAGQNVGTIENSFYNTETSGQTTAIGLNSKSYTATGLTSDEMTSNLCQYIQASWVFPDTWTMDINDNDGYPALTWQDFAHSAICSVPTIVDGVYQIETKDNLLWLSQSDEADWSADYVQTANIAFDAADFEEDGICYNEGAGFSPIGNYDTKFTGSYNGKGYTISNLTIKGSNRTAMFGYASGATLDSINLVDVTVSGAKYTAALAACAVNTSISACTSSGSVTSSGNTFTGGLIANFYGGGSIINCSNSASVTATEKYIGGIACLVNDDSQVSGCYNTGDITLTLSNTGTADAGGLIGAVESSNSTVVITNCYNTGNVTATNGNSAGGVVGTAKGASVTNCYSTGTVTSATQAGGIAGYCGFYTNIFTNCYTQQSTIFGEEAMNSPTNVTTKTTTELQTLSTYTSWDFAGLSPDGTEDIWAISTGMNNGYPVLMWQIEETSAPELGTASVSLDGAIATLSCSFTSLGIANSVTYGFCYSTKETSPNISNSDITNLGAVNGNEAADSFIDEINLSEEGIYYYCAYATNATGTVYSATKTFAYGINSTISWSSPDAITYGTALSSTQLNASATFNDSEVSGTFTYTLDDETELTNGTVLNAGTYNVTLSFVPDIDGYNSVIQTDAGTITVDKADPVITWDTPTSITYGTALDDSQLNASADVNGTFTYNPTAGENLNAGENQTLSVSFAPSDNANYNTVLQTVSIDVAKTSQTITFEALVSKTYGDDDFVLTANSDSELGVSYSSSENSVATISGNTVTIVGSGETVITATQSGDSNYNAATEVTQTLIVNKKTITATANNVTIIKGDAIPTEFTITYSGFEYEDSENDIEELPSATTDADASSPAGNYAISVSGGSDNNYIFKSIPGTLTILVPTVIDDDKISDLKVYPNPASEFIYIDGAQGAVSLYNLAGNKVITHDLNNGNCITISGLAKGIYILNVDNNYVKIIKK